MMHKRFGKWLAAGAIFMLLLPSVASADTKPYFKVFGGDVFAGGWFNSGSATCTVSDTNYQAPTYSPLANQYEGAILSWATSSPRAGASTDFGAFALGLIEGNATAQYGFYSGTSGTGGSSFANANNLSGSYWGGYFAGSAPTHCIPDYYGTKQSSPTALAPASSVSLTSLNHSQYTVTPTGASINVAPSATTIPTGTDLTLFVNGNVYIGSNITYQSGYTANNAPKLAIVAKGEIYIDPSVTQLDGLYIAQPSSGSTSGDIWTCHDATNSTPDGSYIKNNCTNKLTINGAVIAKQVYFFRTNGDLAAAGANETSSSTNIAEVINYVPAMVVGGAFFTSGNTTSAPVINSLISLPPVF